MASKYFNEIQGVIIENPFLDLVSLCSLNCSRLLMGLLLKPTLIPAVLPFPGLRFLSFLCLDKWDNVVILDEIRKQEASSKRALRILLLSGAKDELIPPTHSENLFVLMGSDMTEKPKSIELTLETAGGKIFPGSTKPAFYLSEESKKAWAIFQNGTHNDTCLQFGYFGIIKYWFDHVFK